MKNLLPVIQSNDGRFHNGNPATGEQGTRVTDTWLNDVQDHLRDIGSELIYLLSKANLTTVPSEPKQVYKAIVALIEANRRTASVSQFGETKLTSDTGIGSADLAFSAAGAKNLAQQIAQNKLKFNDYIPNSKKSSAVNSNSADTVATSSAVKTAYDKGVEALNKANAKQSPATTLAGYGITDAFAVGGAHNQSLDLLFGKNQVWSVHNLPEALRPAEMYGYGVGLSLKNQGAEALLYIPHRSGQIWIKNRYLGSKTYDWVRIDGLTKVDKTDISHKTDGTDKTKVASEFALGEVAKKSLPLGSVIGFPKEIAHPAGFLLADGSTFNQGAFPDLYRVLGNTNRLPNLQRSDVGMTAWFAVDNIPAGWIPFDDIASQVTTARYPELHAQLIAKYGALSRVPKVSDRFIRNAGNGLQLGDVQGDAIRNITGVLKADKDVNHGNTQFIDALYTEGAFGIIKGDKSWTSDNNVRNNGEAWGADFDASRVVPTANENRPKSLVLKLCIKAQNSFDDVKFWVKAFGSVDNEGLLVASQLAQGLQGKADRNHTHSVAQITDFNQKTDERVRQAFTYEERNGFTIRKFPDGTMIQTYRFVPPSTRFNANGKKWTFNWAQSFVNKPQIFHQVIGMYTNETIGSIDTWITIQDSQTTNSAVAFWNWENQYNNELIGVDFLAIGRWK